MGQERVVGIFYCVTTFDVYGIKKRAKCSLLLGRNTGGNVLSELTENNGYRRPTVSMAATLRAVI